MSLLPFNHFTVDGFRGLRSLEVKDLRSVNLVVGGNNSGKTSLLEAMALFANPVANNEWLQVVRRRDYGRLDESMVMSLRWCFTQGLNHLFDEPEDLVLESRFTAEGLHPLREMNSTYREFFAEIDPKNFGLSSGVRFATQRADVNDGPVKTCTIESDLVWAEGAKKALIHQQGELIPMPPPSASRLLMVHESMSPLQAGGPIRRSVVHRGRYGPSHAVLLPYSYQLNTLQVSARSDQLFLDDNSMLLDLMRQFDPDVVNVEVASFTGQRPAIYIKHSKLGVAPLSVFGDAMRRCLLLATTMTSLGRGGVLLLDEIEVGIHTDALAKVFKWLADAARQLGVQVVATTHSLEVVDALLAADLGEEDLAAFQIKQAESQTECRRFSAQSLKRLRYERGLDIR